LSIENRSVIGRVNGAANQKSAMQLRFFGRVAAAAVSSPFERIAKQQEHPLDALVVCLPLKK
jgi:hypothetical protein